jgi:hypothetical protein
MSNPNQPNSPSNLRSVHLDSSSTNLEGDHVSNSVPGNFLNAASPVSTAPLQAENPDLPQPCRSGQLRDCCQSRLCRNSLRNFRPTAIWSNPISLRDLRQVLPLISQRWSLPRVLRLGTMLPSLGPWRGPLFRIQATSLPLILSHRWPSCLVRIQGTNY